MKVIENINLKSNRRALACIRRGNVQKIKSPSSRCLQSVRVKGSRFRSTWERDLNKAFGWQSQIVPSPFRVISRVPRLVGVEYKYSSLLNKLLWSKKLDYRWLAKPYFDIVSLSPVMGGRWRWRNKCYALPLWDGLTLQKVLDFNKQPIQVYNLSYSLVRKKFCRKKEDYLKVWRNVTTSVRQVAIFMADNKIHFEIGTKYICTLTNYRFTPTISFTCDAISETVWMNTEQKSCSL